jgi:hypothetical protein
MKMKMTIENNHLIKMIVWLAISFGSQYALESFKIGWLTSVGMYVATAFTMYYCASTFSELKANHEHLDSDTSTAVKSALVFISFLFSTMNLLMACIFFVSSNYGINTNAIIKALEIFVFIYMTHIPLFYILVEVRFIKELKANHTVLIEK